MSDPRVWTPIPTLPPTFVLDTTVTMTWLLTRQSTTYTEAVMRRLMSGVAIVPQTWAVQLADLVRRAERAKTATRAEIDRFYFNLRGFRIRIDAGTSARAWGDVYDLAWARRTTAFDAAYLELALRLRLPLATIDTTLIRAAIAAGVTMFTP